jgi:hypothetical protein
MRNNICCRLQGFGQFWLWWPLRPPLRGRSNRL